MQKYRTKTHYQIGNRLAKLRKEKNLSQLEFGEILADYIGQKTPISSTTVSSWEQNYRQPKVDTIVKIAAFFDVSCDYLFGFSDVKKGHGTTPQVNITDKVKAFDTEIPRRHYADFDGSPVFVKFRDMSKLNQWGILDYESGMVVLKNAVIAFDADGISLYPTAPLPTSKIKIVSYEQLIETKSVLIQMHSKDPAVREHFDGRYHHSNDHTFLVKNDTCETLSYDGLDVTYSAYKG